MDLSEQSSQPEVENDSVSVRSTSPYIYPESEESRGDSDVSDSDDDWPTPHTRGSAIPVKGEAYCDCFRKGREKDCSCGETDSYFEWIWDEKTKSLASFLREDSREVLFHIDYSCGTAAVRGNTPMKNDQYYWEVKMTTPVYGTDMMVGVGTGDIDLDHYRLTFCSLLGRDGDSWGLSYTGLTHHKGIKQPFSNKFGQGTIVGVHLDMWHGTLAFYKNKKPLGIAYRGLQGKTLYPMVSSTAARSGMKVIKCCSFPSSLQFMCCRTIRKVIPANLDVLRVMNFPPGLKAFLDNNISWLLQPSFIFDVPTSNKNSYVYRNFKKSPRKDPVGNLNNSTVVHKSEVKHNRGTTLIVVCSPKDISEQKKTGVQTKYFKDSAKDIKRVTRSSSAERSTQNTLDSSNSDMIESEAKEEDSNIADEKMEEDITESPEIHKSLAVDEASEDDQFPQCHSQEVTEPELLESSDQENRNQDTGTSDLEPVSELLDEGTEKNYTEDEVIEKQPQVYISEVKIEDNDSEMTNPQEFTVMEEDSDSMQNTPSSVTSGEEEYQLSPASDMANKKEFQQRYGKQTKQMERKIFRSKTGKSILTSEQKKIFQSPKKVCYFSQAVYNVRSWQSEMDEEDNEHDSRKSETQTHPPKLKPVKKTIPKFEDVPKRPPKLTRAVHWPTKVGDEAYTSVHVAKDQKELYTVVRNVKQAYEVQEIGETQEYDDDVEYLLHGLQEAEPITTRCLSCIGLAQKCILASFRMHLRAHGTVTQIFSHLQDAPSDPSLALCTSLLLFMLSRDRLNIDLDHQTLNLMLRLLGIDNQEDTNLTTAPAALRALNRNKEKVRETYDLLKKHMGSKLPELESISTGNLAMESLLSLTSKEAGEWFKEELRGRGALDDIVDTVCSCVEAVKDEKLLTDSAIEYLKKVDRCLRVLENVSYTNEDNQSYLISYKSGTLIVALTRALRTCEDCLSVYPLDKFSDMGKVDKESTGWVLYSCILAVLRVLLNLTHENAFGSTRCGQQDDLIQLILISILHTPQFISLDHRFDMLVLGLGLLINMVEHCEVNRRRLIETNTSASYESLLYGQEMKALQALVEVFYHRIEAAARLEEQDLGSASTPDNSFNKSGEWKESDSGMEWVINSAVKQKPTTEKEEKPGPSVRESTPENGELQDEETFTKALHRAGKHMENSIVAAYLALLLGCVIQDNRDFTEEVQQYLHEKSFGEMIRILKKFLGFMNLTTGVGSSGGKSIAHVIEVLETC
ncbi:hypothetical protein ScPMuIL_004320 [Solemya velum]